MDFMNLKDFTVLYGSELKLRAISERAKTFLRADVMVVAQEKLDAVVAEIRKSGMTI